MTKKPYLIMECANSHGGSYSYINNLVNEFSNLDYDQVGIKFQPFKYNQIATSSYEWYDIYKSLFFSEEQWNSIISNAKKIIGDVWLDIFDEYGCRIYKDNLKKINGIKLQPSVLKNKSIYNALEKNNNKAVKIIINVSGLTIDEIKENIKNISKLNFEKIIIQYGYQSYPSQINQTNINIINNFKKNGLNEFEFSYADHISAKDKNSITLSGLCLAAGYSFIEKHIRLSSKTKYDYYSAHTKKSLIKLVDIFKLYIDSCKQSSLAEKKYLLSTYQYPIASKQCNKQLVNVCDLSYKRTNQVGLTWDQINKLQNDRFILKNVIDKECTFKKSDYKKSNVGVVIGCRLKSTRLVNKALLPIGDLKSIEHCIINAKKILNIDKIVLATSYLTEDDELVDIAYKHNIDIFRGDPEDVISRYKKCIDKFGFDIIVRITGDCPLVSPEIANILLIKHFQNAADYTAAKKYSVGTNSEIYSRHFFDFIIENYGSAPMSEYMSFYAINNPDYFINNFVDIPNELIRKYRLTLDYIEDYNMLIELFRLLPKDYTTIDVFNIIDNTAIDAINNHLPTIYKTDLELVNLLNEVTKLK